MRSSMILVTSDSSVSAALATPGTTRQAIDRTRCGETNPGIIDANTVAPCSRDTARPTGSASPARSVPNSTRPVTSIVSVRISAATSTPAPGVHCAARRRAAATIAGAKDWTCRWLNTGCTSLRCRCQTTPSLVSRPSPRNAFSGR